jgi:phosphoglycerate dehydrogenase-like enzyme
VYHIDFDAIDERGIVVAKATGGGCTGAAELAIGLMIALMRRIPTVDRALKDGEWPTPMTHVLRGKTLGIVGLGYVGRHVAKIANAFEMRVLAWGPRLSADAAAAVGAESADLDSLMRVSDIVSIHATLGADSRGLIDARRLGLMKPSAYLINTARGPIVEEDALCRALETGRISGAGLDVFDEEPLPPDHRIRKLPNVVLTPHLGWPTDEMYSRFADAAADALLAHLDGREVPRFVAHH